jgi:hypothetical protein
LRVFQSRKRVLGDGDAAPVVVWGIVVIVVSFEDNCDVRGYVVVCVVETIGEESGEDMDAGVAVRTSFIAGLSI